MVFCSVDLGLRSFLCLVYLRETYVTHVTRTGAGKKLAAADTGFGDEVEWGVMDEWD